MIRRLIPFLLGATLVALFAAGIELSMRAQDVVDRCAARGGVAVVVKGKVWCLRRDAVLPVDGSEGGG